MMYQKENKLIQRLTPQLFRLVEKHFGGTLSSRAKSAEHDLVTPLDIAADKLLVTTLTKHFPKDALLIEESSPDMVLGNGRTWVIDPICGTGNLAAGIRLFVTNIALVENGIVRAAWVIDHSRQRILWSTGTGLWEGNRRIAKLSQSKRFAVVDVNWGYYYLLDTPLQKKYAALSSDVHLEGKMWAIDTQSSICFAYVATGQIEGATTLNINAWDFAAPAFLIEHNGGIVTNFDGSSWNLKSKSLLMAGNRPLHKILLQYIQKHHLQTMK